MRPRRSRAAWVLLSALTVAAAVELVSAGPAWAAAGNDGLIAVLGLGFLINRRYAELATFLLAAVVVAWLVFSPDDVAHAARAIGNQIF
jgi:hypothetical protein